MKYSDLENNEQFKLEETKTYKKTIGALISHDEDIIQIGKNMISRTALLYVELLSKKLDDTIIIPKLGEIKTEKNDKGEAVITMHVEYYSINKGA